VGVYYDFDEVDAFTVAAPGEPGRRTFLLQVRRGGTRLTIKCEKQQAAAIADYLRKVLDDAPAPTDRPVDGVMELVEPTDPLFVLGPVGLGYDREHDRVVIQLEEVIPVDEDGEVVAEEDDDRGTVRLFLTRSQAAAFCEQADRVVAAGRPNCIFCGQPIDPQGHRCPRMN
jgi:uncharacterized repeat protein (TIGR03847 family)